MSAFLRRADFWSGLALVALGAYIVREAWSWDYMGDDGPGPGFFPMWYGGAMIVLSLLLVAGAVLKSDPASSQRQRQLERAAPCDDVLGGLRRVHRVAECARVRRLFRLDDLVHRGGAVPQIAAPCRRARGRGCVGLLRAVLAGSRHIVACGILVLAARRHGYSERAAAWLRCRAKREQSRDVLHRCAARHGDRRAARAGPTGHDRDAVAVDDETRAHRRDDHAGGHLLRREVRRLDHIDPAQRAGRVGFGCHVLRRLSDGAQGSCGACARHERDRIVHRRHVWSGRADAGRATAREAVARVQRAGVLRADGAWALRWSFCCRANR